MSFKVKSSTIGFKVMDGDKPAYEVTVGPYGASAIITDSKGKFCSVPLDGQDFAPHHTFPMPQEAIDAVNRGVSALRDGKILDEVQKEPEIIDLGRAGNECIWSLDDSGRLTISGKGPMYDYVDGNRPDYIERHPHEIKSITVEEGITKIGASAFTGTSAKEAWIGLDVSEIGNSAFAGCHGLDSMVIPSNVEKIGANAFYNSGLSNILICEGVKEIGSSAFAYCSELSAISLPSSVEQVGDYAFSHTEAAVHTYNPEMIPDSAIWGEKGSPVIDVNKEWDEEDIADDFSDPAEWE